MRYDRKHELLGFEPSASCLHGRELSWVHVHRNALCVETSPRARLGTGSDWAALLLRLELGCRRAGGLRVRWSQLHPHPLTSQLQVSQLPCCPLPAELAPHPAQPFPGGPRPRAAITPILMAPFVRNDTARLVVKEDCARVGNNAVETTQLRKDLELRPRRAS